MGAAGDGLGDGLHTDLLVHRPLHLRDPPVGRGQRPGDAGERGGRDWREKGRAPPPVPALRGAHAGGGRRRDDVGRWAHGATLHTRTHSDTQRTHPLSHAPTHAGTRNNNKKHASFSNVPTHRWGADGRARGTSISRMTSRSKGTSTMRSMLKGTSTVRVVVCGTTLSCGGDPRGRRRRGGGRSLGRPRYSPVLRKSGGPQFRIWKGDSG